MTTRLKGVASFGIRYVLYPAYLVVPMATAAVLLARGTPPFAAVNGVLLMAIGMAFLIEQVAPDRPALRTRDETVTDTLHVLAASVAVPLIMPLALGPVSEGVDRAGQSMALAGRWPLAWQVIVAVLVADFFYYWLHRLSHENGDSVLWRIHAVHHSITYFDLLAGGRRHLLYPVAIEISAFIPLGLLGFDPAAVALAVLFDSLVGIAAHWNLDTRPGLLDYVAPGVRVHRVHHALDLSIAQNYGGCTAVFDLMFGTWVPPQRYEGELGLVGMEAFPATFSEQVLLVVPSRWRLAALPPQ